MGSQRALARALGISAVAIGQWGRAGPSARGVPLKQCVRIEQLTQGAVSRKELRPDDWLEIWPELEEVARLRAQVAQLMERLRKYEPYMAPALTQQSPVATNPEAKEGVHG